MTFRVQTTDTSLEAERYQLEILRRKTEAGRCRMLRSLMATTRRLSWHTKHVNLESS